ncbi:hypothetical protein, partial [Escherichia coli]|uniref:hypothetical protein n=1 Tax=Escherichia coli TaxID=562 RepID=UPI0032E39DFC
HTKYSQSNSDLVMEHNRSYLPFIIEGMGTETSAAKMASFDRWERWCHRTIVLAAVWAAAVVVLVGATGDTSNTRWFFDPIFVAVCSSVSLFVVKAKCAVLANITGSEVEWLNNLHRHSR